MRSFILKSQGQKRTRKLIADVTLKDDAVSNEEKTNKVGKASSL